MPMTEKSFLSLGSHGFHRLAYAEWGPAAGNRVVVCLHGMTRTGRDFDFVAAALEDVWRVACPDLPGRGRSHWLTTAAEYAPPVYMADMAALIARVAVDAVDWIGTSLGGLIGMMLAAQPNTPIRKLVLNDVGAFVPKGALLRISEYVGTDPTFRSVEVLEAYLREIHAPFGPLSDEQWRHLARHSGRFDESDGLWRLHYDPKLGTPLKEGQINDVDLWALWERIECPVLILRGAESDILLKETAEEMLTRGPVAELIEFPEIGHAPALMDPAQIGVVRTWLLAD
jgi:pimeloyl-ACP methyl ester carboxylesterase